MKYPKYSFVKTTVNSRKKSTKMVRTQLLKKSEAKSIRLQYAKKGKGYGKGLKKVKAYAKKGKGLGILLKDLGDNLVLTEKWATGVLEKPKWNKRKGVTEKVVPSRQFLAEEKFSFQRNISSLVTEHDIPPF